MLFEPFVVRLQAEAARVTIVPPSMLLFEQAMQMYRDRDDKEWSLTDCVSFVIMKDQNIGEGLTADHHFEQAGFIALLAEE